MTKKQKNLLLRIIAGAVLMVLFSILPLKKYPLLRFVLFLVPYFTVGYDILRKAWKGILNRQVFDENFLMAVATVGAMVLGEYTEGVAVMLFYQIGELFQNYAVGKSRRNISELMDIRPDTANLIIEEDPAPAASGTGAGGAEGSTDVAAAESTDGPGAGAAGVSCTDAAGVSGTGAGGAEGSADVAAAESAGGPGAGAAGVRIETVDSEDVEVGSLLLVRPGERVPIDGVVVSGTSSLDTSALTGESLPRSIGPGQEILSGSINLSGVLHVRTTKEFGESTASRILDLVENAGSRKAKSEQFISRFAHWYTPVVCYSALELAVLGPVLSMLLLNKPGGWPLWSDWIYRALTFLVISCPCAIVVSIPLTFFGGIGGAGSKGILIKGSNFMETLANVRTVVFDKTGTLTKGNFAVTKICPASMDSCPAGAAACAEAGTAADAYTNEQDLSISGENGQGGTASDRILEYAALAESGSNHPISRSLREAYLQSLKIRGGFENPSRIGEVEEIRGKGVIAEVDGRRVTVGSLRLIQDLGIAVAAEDDHSAWETGTVVHVAVGDRYLGHIVISDEIKPGAAEAVRSLRQAGVARTVMLTGDAEGIAAHVAGELGVDEYHARLLPEEKVQWVERLLADETPAPDSAGKAQGEEKADREKLKEETEGKRADQRIKHGGALAFVGDGMNDAPVLSRADIGIAMGALGSDAAIEAADVVLMDDDPLKIAKAIRIARKCIRIVNENIWFAIGVKALCLILGAAGIANMWIAIFADVGVMVLCVLNAIRALAA
ncbi:MAG: HAD-IC family P-type ATPase [Eubacteriales bacterium]|nr:HAD-IC family P-type ATPase [Eubacteriales bacterium]